MPARSSRALPLSMRALMPRFAWVLAVGAPALVRGMSLELRTTQTQAQCADSFNWADNSQGYAPCLMTAVVWGSCFTGNWNVPALTQGNQYTDPNSTTANLCTCSWAAYNLISACTACQGFDGSVANWAGYSQSCGNFLSETWFPDKVNLPDNTKVPFWAGTDPTTWPNGRFDAQQASAIAAQHQPEFSQGASSNGDGKSKTPVGAIAGGVVGGVAILVLGGVVAFCCLCRGRSSVSGKDAAGYAHSRNPSGPGSIRSYFSRPTIHARSMSDLSGHSILAPQQTNAPSMHRPGTIYTTVTGQTRTGSVHSLSYYGSPVTSPGPGSMGFAALQAGATVNREEIIEPFTVRATSPSVSGHIPARKLSESTLRSAYTSHEGALSQASGSASASLAPTPGTPSAQMASYMDAVPEHAEVRSQGHGHQGSDGYDFIRARDAQEIELQRLTSAAAPPAYTPHASPSTSPSVSPEPQPADPLSAARFGNRKRPQPSVDSGRSFMSESTVRTGHAGDGSISAIDDVIEQMGLALPSSPTAATTVGTGQSEGVQGRGEKGHRPTVSNP